MSRTRCGRMRQASDRRVAGLRAERKALWGNAPMLIWISALFSTIRRTSPPSRRSSAAQRRPHTVQNTYIPPPHSPQSAHAETRQGLPCLPDTSVDFLLSYIVSVQNQWLKLLSQRPFNASTDLRNYLEIARPEYKKGGCGASSI